MLDTFALYAGIVLFGFPACLFFGLTIMMMTDLVKEDETIKIGVTMGGISMLVGALLLLWQILF